MKSAKSIINHLIRQPQNSKVLEVACFEKVKNMLPKHLATAVLFMYKKNQTLYFVLNHPGMKMEFNYKHSLIKNLLNKLKELDENCKDINISNIQSFVSNKIPLPHEKPHMQKRYYVEKSTGTFENRAKNSALQTLFEEIKSTLVKQS